MKPVAIQAAGMVTGVGLNAPSSCAAIRCAIDNFSETHFIDSKGEAIIASQVLLNRPWRGLRKLVHMVVPAIRECLGHIGKTRPDSIPLLLCVAERDRPGRLEGLQEQLFAAVQSELGVCFHPTSATIGRGRVGGAVALELASKLIHVQRVPFCVIAGVDTLLVAQTLAAYEEKNRLLTSQNSNGFIPGEAGAAVLVGPMRTEISPELLCVGTGKGQERATVDSEQPLRADGLVQALKSASADAGIPISDLDYRITDANGEQYWFKESALALDRCLRNRKELFDIWHPADCVGEIGAAVGPCIFGIALYATRKRYAVGRGPLCHFSGDDGDRWAAVMIQRGSRST